MILSEIFFYLKKIYVIIRYQYLCNSGSVPSIRPFLKFLSIKKTNLVFSKLQKPFMCKIVPQLPKP